MCEIWNGLAKTEFPEEFPSNLYWSIPPHFWNGNGTFTENGSDNLYSKDPICIKGLLINSLTLPRPPRLSSTSFLLPPPVGPQPGVQNPWGTRESSLFLGYPHWQKGFWRNTSRYQGSWHPWSTCHFSVGGHWADCGRKAYEAPKAPCELELVTLVMALLSKPQPHVDLTEWVLRSYTSKHLTEITRIVIEQE